MICQRTSTLKGGFQLTVNKNVGVSTDRGGEVGIEGDIHGIMAILRDIEHTGAEILGALSGLERNELKKLAGGGVGDIVEGFHEGTRRGRVHRIAKTFSAAQQSVLTKDIYY